VTISNMKALGNSTIINWCTIVNGIWKIVSITYKLKKQIEKCIEFFFPYIRIEIYCKWSYTYGLNCSHKSSNMISNKIWCIVVNEIWKVTSITYNIKNAFKFYFVFILELKYIRCMDLIVHTSLSFCKGKKETWNFVKMFENNH
jgi:hypothetical protein